jgi:large subunit ribosomal protein L17
MRHRIHQRKLNRTTEHRKALLRNMAQNLVEHGRITTTLPKAKALRPYFERLVTLAVKTRKLADADDKAGSLRARRRIHQLLGDRGLIPAEHRSDYDGMSDARRAKTMRMPSGRRHRTGDPKGRLVFTAESVTRRLIEKVAPRFEDRPGGYTRLIRLANRRLGDAAPLAVLQLLGDEEAPLSVTKPGKLARHRRADARYAMAIKAAKEWRDRPATREEPADDAPADQDGDAAPEADTEEA